MIDPNLITTVRVGELPPEPLTLDSLIPHEIGTDLKSGTIQQLLDLLRPLVGKLQYEVVRMSVDSQYIIDNFDVTGLGTNLCLGFAICNGNNGTENLDGRSGIGYGANYNFVGLPVGSADSVVVSHSHTYTYENTRGTGIAGAEDGTSGIETGTTSTVGESGVNKNYHPSIVQLYMMKL
jgi:hypothetical protein